MIGGTGYGFFRFRLEKRGVSSILFFIMSRENVMLFYSVLDRDPALRARALGLRKTLKDQEDVLDAFLALAEETGFPFTLEEYLSVQYERASFTDPEENNRKARKS